MALNLAAEESERLAQRYIGTELLLLGMLRMEGSLAAKLLRKRGLNPEAIREQLANAPGSVSLRASAEPSRGAITTLESFLSGLKWLNAEELISFFAKNAVFIDADCEPKTLDSSTPGDKEELFPSPSFWTATGPIARSCGSWR